MNGMEQNSDKRFDTNFAAQVLVDIAQERSLELLFHRLLERAMEALRLACVQVWLVEKGDLCATCPHRAACPETWGSVHDICLRNSPAT
jgi:hypothetical protein